MRQGREADSPSRKLNPKRGSVYTCSQRVGRKLPSGKRVYRNRNIDWMAWQKIKLIRMSVKRNGKISRKSGYSGPHSDTKSRESGNPSVIWTGTPRRLPDSSKFLPQGAPDILISELLCHAARDGSTTSYPHPNVRCRRSPSQPAVSLSRFALVPTSEWFKPDVLSSQTTSSWCQTCCPTS